MTIHLSMITGDHHESIIEFIEKRDMGVLCVMKEIDQVKNKPKVKKAKRHKFCKLFNDSFSS